jgi:hypothetical protein
LSGATWRCESTTIIRVLSDSDVMSKFRKDHQDEADLVVRDTVTLVEQLNDMGYVIGFGSVVINTDSLVMFWVEGDAVTFEGDLKRLGFHHSYELRPVQESRHPILPRD